MPPSCASSASTRASWRSPAASAWRSTTAGRSRRSSPDGVATGRTVYPTYPVAGSPHGGRTMSLTSLRLREAWNWGGLSAWQLAVRTYQAMDRHETLDRAAVVAFWTMLALVPFLGFVLALALGGRGQVADQLL